MKWGGKLNHHNTETIFFDDENKEGGQSRPKAWFQLSWGVTERKL